MVLADKWCIPLMWCEVLWMELCLLAEWGEAVCPILHSHTLVSVCSREITPFIHTHAHFPPSQPKPVRESVCLNLLFVIQVISEEGVSFKVSLSLFSQCAFLSCIFLFSLLLWCNSVCDSALVLCVFLMAFWDLGNASDTCWAVVVPAYRFSTPQGPPVCLIEAVMSDVRT